MLIIHDTIKMFSEIHICIWSITNIIKEIGMDQERALGFIQDLKMNKDEIIQELLEELLRSASTYASMRLEWFHMNRETKAAKDELRSGMHNRFMDSLTILKRYMDKLEITYGDIFDYSDCKEAGDFACKLAYWMMIESR